MSDTLRDTATQQRSGAASKRATKRVPPGAAVAHPLLYQINTRVLLRSIDDKLGRAATLDDIRDDEFDRIAAQGFDFVWFLGVWQTGEAGRRVSLSNPEWRHEFETLLPDLTERDICGSCFAITGYTTHTALGGDAALARLRRRLGDRGLALLLDFVPNHMAPDHPWVKARPELFVQGTPQDMARAPGNYCRLDTDRGPVIFAYGRDPYFPGWPDTIQLNYGEPATQAAMRQELARIADRCDAVRCDMAMLILPDVFQRTWGISAQPFWPDTVRQIKERHQGFRFMAEVYWDLEWTMQQQGFDFTYDKRLYDRLAARKAGPVRDHLRAGIDFQDKSARFLENHDEPRAAATFPFPVHQAAAIVTYLSPGLRFFHQGQFDGRAKRIPVHLCRGPDEPLDAAVQDFYRRLLDVLKLPALRAGQWQLLDAGEAWGGNWTAGAVIAFAWQGADGRRLLVAVNFADHQSQCFVRPPWQELAGRQLTLADRMGSERYEREGDELLARGLYLDLPPWGYNVFEIT